jgi:hypothetical protein
VLDGNGAALTTGVKGYLICPFNATITGVTLLGDQSGSIVVDIWKCTEAQFDAGSTHPVVGDSITASSKPTITTATKYNDTTLSGWTTTVTAGDIFAYDISSVSSFQRVTVALQANRR